VPHDWSNEGLFKPQTRPAFVGAEAMPRFRADVRGFDLVNAWWLSNAAHAAYFDEEGTRRELAKAGWRVVEYYLRGGTEGYMAEGEGFAILAFRGTQHDDWNDVKADLKFPLAPFTGGTRAHTGFREALDQVWAGVVSCLAELEAKGVPVWFTGHSLGAALAVCAAARRTPAALYTFGAPRVGDEAFTRLLAGTAHQRLVNCCDMVTTLPPDWLGFRHAGEERYFSLRRRVWTDPRQGRVFWDRLVAMARYALTMNLFRRGRVGFRSLGDHSMLNYTAAIEKALRREAVVSG